MANKIQFTHDDCEVVKREVLYQGVFCLAKYHIRTRLFKGGWSDVFTREVFERRSAAAVLPYDPASDRVILIEQFRAGGLADAKSPWLIEIPAGIFSNQETPEELIYREAKEEAGCTITDPLLISDYFVSPGGNNEYLYLFCAKTNASHVSGIHGLEYEHEDIRVINLPATEAFAKVRTGEIKTAPAIISLLWLEINREKLRRSWGQA